MIRMNIVEMYQLLAFPWSPWSSSFERPRVQLVQLCTKMLEASSAVTFRIGMKLMWLALLISLHPCTSKL
jgi:hypothetical protein